MAKGICFLCGNWEQLEEHHIFPGMGMREVSDRYGLTVKLCPWCHRIDRDSAHQSGATRLYLQKHGERMFLAQGHTVEEFIAAGFKNVLDEDEIDEILHPVKDRGAFALIEEPEPLPF